MTNQEFRDILDLVAATAEPMPIYLMIADRLFDALVERGGGGEPQEPQS